MDLQKLFDHIDDSIKQAGSLFFLGAIVLIEYPSNEEIQAIENKLLRPILVDKKPSSDIPNVVWIEENGWGNSKTKIISFCMSGRLEWINQGHDFNDVAYNDLEQYAKEKNISVSELVTSGKV